MNDQMIDESRLNMSTLGNARVSIKHTYLGKALFTSYNINVVPFLVNLNGVSIALRTNTTPATEPFINQPSFITIGRMNPRDNTSTSDMNGQFEGVISQFRIVKGEAIYTADFTRPSLPLMPVPGTILILSP